MNKLFNVLDFFLKEDHEAAQKAFSEYFKEKSAKMYSENTEPPIRLKGKDVYVKHKLVGHIQNDHTDKDSKILLTLGNDKKSFESMADMYRFLFHKFNIKEAANAIPHPEVESLLKEHGVSHDKFHEKFPKSETYDRNAVYEWLRSIGARVKNPKLNENTDILTEWEQGRNLKSEFSIQEIARMVAKRGFQLDAQAFVKEFGNKPTYSGMEVLDFMKRYNVQASA